MDDRTRQTLVYDARRKSLLISYLLWWFLGYAGVHRFYLGMFASGLFMLLLFIVSLVLSLILIGYFGLLLLAIWWIIDAFLLPGMVTQANLRIIDRIR